MRAFLRAWARSAELEAEALGISQGSQPSSSTWPDSSDAAPVERWERWYVSAVSGRDVATPLSVFDSSSPASDAPSWVELAQLARDRSLPPWALALLSARSGLWSGALRDATRAAESRTALAQLRDGTAQGDRNERAWWSRAVTLPWPASAAQGDGGGGSTPDTRPPTRRRDTGGAGVIAATIAGAIVVIMAKRRRGRR